MSNKMDFFKKFKDGNLDLQGLREFVQSHPGVKWRRQGKGAVQVSFRQNEGWYDVAAFLDNYKSADLKNLVDQLYKSLEIQGSATILKQLQFDDEAFRYLADQGFISLQEHDSKLKELEDQVKSLRHQLEERTTEVEELKEKYDKADKQWGLWEKDAEQWVEMGKEAIQAWNRACSSVFGFKSDELKPALKRMEEAIKKAESK